MKKKCTYTKQSLYLSTCTYGNRVFQVFIDFSSKCFWENSPPQNFYILDGLFAPQSLLETQQSPAKRQEKVEEYLENKHSDCRQGVCQRFPITVQWHIGVLRMVYRCATGIWGPFTSKTIGGYESPTSTMMCLVQKRMMSHDSCSVPRDEKGSKCLVRTYVIETRKEIPSYLSTSHEFKI